jgi:thymidylate synthase (FAD)
LEGEKYFGRKAADGEDGTEADRLIRQIMRSKHTSTVEHLTYTFAIEGLSRSALAQLTRHRFFSFSVQSQRYIRFGSKDKSGGFDYVIPPKIRESKARTHFVARMEYLQYVYDLLREYEIPPEDARFILPAACATNLVMTGNLRAILEFYGKRKSGRGAQWEISELAEAIRREVTKVDPWTDRFFDEV